MSEKPYHNDERFQTGEPERRSRSRRAKNGGGTLEFLVILLISFALVFGFVRPYVVEAFYIPSASMVPTLLINDRVLVNKFIYRFVEPERGEIIVFRSVDGPPPDENPIKQLVGLSERVVGFFGGTAQPVQPQSPDLIKRVVGVPGDRISVRDGALFVNGERQKEPYVNSRLPDRSFFAPTTVPKNHVFVMGDNRANSQDSRVFGPVPDENIEGEAFLRFWPLDRIGIL